MATPRTQTVVVVSHTHWDREWYHPLGRMRQRLTTLIDDLLDRPDGLPFLLDGQAIVLDDYCAVRPERSGALKDALRTALLEAGPWYVLADMLIPGGEALVRNLLEGRRTVLEAGGSPPPVLYSPDAFGQSSAGPVLARGFGLDVAIVWRGYGGASHPAGTLARWSHADGSTVLLYHLPPGGYEVGSSLPMTEDAAAQRWRAMHDLLLGANPVGVALLPNGADHHARQLERVEAVRMLMSAAAPVRVVCDTLRGFSARLSRACADVSLPEVRGELRDSAGWTWALQGTFATRAHQKRMNAQVERLLVRETEPWSALAWYAFGHEERGMRAAWKTLLSTHPHDTLCGCSVDEVAFAADARWADARSQAAGIRDDAVQALVGFDAAAHREPESHWRTTLVLRNPSARTRGGAVRLRLIDTVVNDPVGPGSAKRTGVRAPTPPASPQWSGHDSVQVLQRTRQFDRVESPQHYPRNAVAHVTDAVAWIEPVAGYSVHPCALADLHEIVRHAPPDQIVSATESELTGPAWRIASSVQGVVAMHATTGARVNPIGWLESATDAGDSYTPSLRGDAIAAYWSAPRLVARGPLRAEWEMSTRFERVRDAITPATDASQRELPPRELVSVSATVRLSLTAGTDRIDVSICGDNAAGDHRLRWLLPLPGSLHLGHVIADAAFGPVRRDANPRDVHEWPAEERIDSAPLHRWVSVTGEAYGLGVISDGLAEYELLPNGHLAITLVRAVGELSRRDLPERPGHAGWPAATPLAQSRGPFEANFSIIVLPQDADAALAQLEMAADDLLLPMSGDSWRGVATPLAEFSGLTLEGEGLVFSAAKRSEDGEWLVLRCQNQRATVMQGAWHLPRPASDVCLSRLDERPGVALAGTGSRIQFEAPPFGIVTLLVR